MQTAREMIKEKIEEVRKNILTLNGNELSVYLVELSSLYSNFAEGLTRLEQLYALRRMELREEYKTASMTNLVAETTDEYREYAEAKRLEKALIDITRSIKVRIKVLIKEEETSYNT